MQDCKVLYLSYDGMTDPLGQSQVIPYLKGLSKKGFKFTLVSCEKEANYVSRREYIAHLLGEIGITWVPLSYTKRPPVLSTIWDLMRLNNTCKELLRNNNFSIIHCRSYVTSIIGYSLARTGGLKFIFDMRGFWADERVDGALWNLRNPLYNLVFKYFKNKEREFLGRAHAVVCLTDQAKTIINGWDLMKDPNRLHIIPCSADFDNFSIKTINSRRIWRGSLEVPEDTLVLSYLGSLGTWYLLDEMLKFFVMLKKKFPNSIFLFVTPEPKNLIFEKAVSMGLKQGDMRVLFAERKEISAVMSASDINIFFIKPAFSKKGSSPTKLGEVLAMGIPVICNNGVGDVGEVLQRTEGGVSIKDFSIDSFNEAIDHIPRLLNLNGHSIREKAFKYYDLTTGVQAYEKVYHSVLLKS